MTTPKLKQCSNLGAMLEYLFYQSYIGLLFAMLWVYPAVFLEGCRFFVPLNKQA